MRRDELALQLAGGLHTQCRENALSPTMNCAHTLAHCLRIRRTAANNNAAVSPT